VFGPVGIGPRLALAFAAMAAVTCLVVLANFLSARSVTRDIQTAQSIRLPASLTAEQAQASLLKMQMRIRGYLVLSDPADVANYKEAKRDFEGHLKALQVLAKTLTAADAATVQSLSALYEKWVQLPQTLFDLHDNPLRNRAALRVARLEIQPRRVEALKRLEAMIETQRGLNDSVPVRSLMFDLVTFRSSFDSLTTNLIAYASSGDLTFRFAYGPQLSTNAALWLSLKSRQSQLGAGQREHVEHLEHLRAEIGELAIQVIDSATGERAYDDRYLYRTQVEPQAENMLRLLALLTARQHDQLQSDVERAEQSLGSARITGIGGGVLAIMLAVSMVMIAYRRIVRPVRSLTQVAQELAAGDATVVSPSQARDEITRLADTIRTRLRQDELQRIMASVPDALWSAEVDAAGALHYRYYSPVVEQIAGRPSAHFVASPLHWQEIVHPGDKDLMLQALQRIVSGESTREDIEYRIYRPDRTARWVRDSVRSTQLSDGRVVLNGVVSDITERRVIESELRARQEMLDLAQRVARIVAFDLRLAPGRTERWPEELDVLHGLERGAFDCTLASWKKLMPPEDWATVKQAMKRAHETGDVAYEYRVTHPDGSVHWLQVKGRLFLGPDKTPARMAGFVLEVTEQHQAKAELQRLEEQLHRAQRLEAMGTLAGGIAHDFNNILGAILGYGEMAARDALPGTRLKRDLDSIMAAGERGRALVDRILAFSRSAVGERVPVHAENVVREALELIAATAPENVTVEAHLNAGNAAMMGDPTQLHQVLTNLAANAMQAMSKGGVLEVRLHLVHLEASRLLTTGKIDAGPYLVLEVEDSGTGIASDILDRIFDPFFTTKEVGVGTGLGLSLVHGIISQIGGAVDVSTKPGAGSLFTVYLPQSGFAAEAMETSAQELPTGHGQRVVVLDDEEALARLTSENLIELGYSTITFVSSVAALRSIQAHPGDFDAVITDERMPDMSGSAIVREIRQLRPDVPIIVASGNLSPDLIAKVLEAGADEVLKKPVLLRELALVIARVLHIETATAPSSQQRPPATLRE
jgi:PAS domain S-box-containing protein